VKTKQRSELASLRVGAPEDLGRPIRSLAVLSAQVTREDGRPVLLAIAGTSGVPTLNVVDVRDNRLLRAFPLAKGAGGSWGGTVLPDGTAYLITYQRLIRYDPRKKRAEDLGIPIAGETAFWSLAHDEQGHIYGGSYPNGKVFRFDPKTGRFSVLAEVGQPYVRSTAYHDGTLYAGTSPTPSGKIHAIDVRTGARRELPLPDMAAGLPNQVYGLDVRAGRCLFAFLTFPDKSSTLRVYDLRERRWWPEEFPGYGEHYVGPERDGPERDGPERDGPERDGVVLLRWKGYWHELDLATRKARRLPRPAGVTYRGGGWADLGGGAPSLVSVTFEGAVVVTDPATGAPRTLPPVMQSEPAGIQALAVSPDGRRVYVSGYLASRAAMVDTATGAATLFPMGQAEGIVAHGNRVWWGVYPGAHLHEMDAAAPLAAKRNPREVYHVPEEQDRPFGVAASDRWAVFGTVPVGGRLGGSLTVLDRRTGAWTSRRNIVPDQSLVALALRGDVVYGTTSVHGGLGGGEPRATAARVFAWDLRTGRKIAETALTPAGGGRPARFIGGVAVGPDGRVWAAAAGSLFALDPETLAVTDRRALLPRPVDEGRWRPPFVGFGPDGLLYTNVGNEIRVADPATGEVRALGIRADLMALGPDGWVYYRPAEDVAGLKRVRVG